MAEEGAGVGTIPEDPNKEIKEKIQITSSLRLEICRKCDENSENKKKTGWHTLRPDEHCVNCGCTLSAKTKCLSCECPLKKWLAIATVEEEQELKSLTDE